MGATYQRAMTTIFHDMMHTFMEDYVDDILAKSHTRPNHLPILGKIFTHLEAFKVRLNPKKCAFGVQSRKLLGYIVSAKGIEADPQKVQSIIDMKLPKKFKSTPLSPRKNLVHQKIHPSVGQKMCPFDPPSS